MTPKKVLLLSTLLVPVMILLWIVIYAQYLLFHSLVLQGELKVTEILHYEGGSYLAVVLADLYAKNVERRLRCEKS